MKGPIALMLAASLVMAAIPTAAQDLADLERGIREVEGGRFEEAVITLDAAALSLALEGRHPKELARAYAYLAIAYLQMSHEQAAKAKFLEALRADKDLRLDPKLPPSVIQFFQDAAREENSGSATTPLVPPSTTAPTPTTSGTTTTGAKGKSSKTVPIVIGAGAVAAGVGVLAAAGGKDSVSTPTTMLPPATTTLAQLSANVTSPQRSTNIVCTQSVLAVVTLINGGPTNVAVTGVRHENRAVSGGCTAAQSFTFGPSATLVGTNQTVTVLNNTLFTNGSGCCNPTGTCNGSVFCEFTSVFTVVTSVGEVPAGGFNYGITFNRCGPCSSSLGATSNCTESAPPR